MKAHDMTFDENLGGNCILADNTVAATAIVAVNKCIVFVSWCMRID